MNVAESSHFLQSVSGMPVSKEQVVLSEAGSDRLHLYGGSLDLVNGSLISGESIRQLKFGARFYKHILVPDGFFHCQGPLHTHLSRAAQLSLVAQESDPILDLMRSGVLVPVIRRSDSLVVNLASSRDLGVVPGDFLTVTKEEGRAGLTLADRVTSHFASWPELLSPKVDSTYWLAVSRSLLSQESPYRVTMRDPPSGVAGVKWLEWRSCQELLDDFERMLRDYEGNRHFRRGDVEKCIDRHLPFEFSSYQELLGRIDWDVPANTSLASLSYFLLSVASTAYEVNQAQAFGSVGGLFPLHDQPLIDLGIHGSLVNLGVLDRANAESELAYGSLDVDRLSIADILNFRRNAKSANGELIFDVYQRCIESLKPPQDGESFEEANPEYLQFLCDQYIPGILKMFPGVGFVGETARGLGTAVALVGIAGTSMGETVSVGGAPIVEILAAGGVMLGWGATHLENLGGYLLKKRRVEQFRRNNYALWRRRE